jgi:hypothetical protein
MYDESMKKLNKELMKREISINVYKSEKSMYDEMLATALVDVDYDEVAVKDSLTPTELVLNAKANKIKAKEEDYKQNMSWP